MKNLSQVFKGWGGEGDFQPESLKRPAFCCFTPWFKENANFRYFTFFIIFTSFCFYFQISKHLLLMFQYFYALLLKDFVIPVININNILIYLESWWCLEVGWIKFVVWYYSIVCVCVRGYGLCVCVCKSLVNFKLDKVSSE